MVPIETVGSPFSNRQRVSLLTKRREAMSAVDIPRLRLARERSRPIFRNVWITGNGNEEVFTVYRSDISDIKSTNI